MCNDHLQYIIHYNSVFRNPAEQISHNFFAGTVTRPCTPEHQSSLTNIVSSLMKFRRRVPSSARLT